MLEPIRKSSIVPEFVIFGDVDHYGKPVIRYAYEQCGDLKPIIRDGRIYVIQVEDHKSSIYVVECN